MNFSSPPQLTTPMRIRSSRFPELARDATPTPREPKVSSRRRRGDDATGRKPRMAVGNREQMKKYLADSYTRHEEISILPGQRNDYRTGFYGTPSIKLYDTIVQEQGGAAASTANSQHFDMSFQNEKYCNLMNSQPPHAQQLPLESNERKAQLARRAAQEYYKAQLDLQIAQQTMFKQQEKAREKKVYLPGTKPKNKGPITTYESDDDKYDNRQIVPLAGQTPYLPEWFKPVLPTDPLLASPSPDERGSPRTRLPHYEIQSQVHADENGTTIAPLNGQMQLISNSQLQNVTRSQAIPVPVPENSVLLIQRFPQSSPNLQLSPGGNQARCGDKAAVESIILSISPQELTMNDTMLKQHVSQTADQRPGTIVRKRNYSCELQQQIEDRRRREHERKRAEQLEEEKNELRIKEDQEQMLREYAEEKLRQKKKEEETLKRQEEIIKQDLIRKKEAEEEKRKRMEKKRRPQLCSADSKNEEILSLDPHHPQMDDTGTCGLSPETPAPIRSTNSPPIVSQYSLYLANHPVDPEESDGDSHSQQLRNIASKPILTEYTLQSQIEKEAEEFNSNSSPNPFNSFYLSETNTSEKEMASEHATPRKRRVRKRVGRSKPQSHLGSENNCKVLEQWKHALEMELVRSKLAWKKMLEETSSESEF